MWSALIIAGAIVGSFYLGDSLAERLYFISLTGMGMLTTVGVIVSMDTYGPVSDNAQGIAEMSGEFEGRPAEILGGLDAVGNSTKAITKGMAIATAVLAATSLFGSFAEAVLLAMNRAGQEFPIRIATRTCSSGSSWVARSRSCSPPSRSAPWVAPRCRSWSRSGTSSATTRGSWTTEKPDYGRVVDICTQTSLRELTTPGLLAVLSPVIAGFFLGAEGLGAFLAGSILTGQLLAVMLSNSGGAWDNAKKFIEEGTTEARASPTRPP